MEEWRLFLHMANNSGRVREREEGAEGGDVVQFVYVGTTRHVA
jgi:hypothetical protein